MAANKFHLNEVYHKLYGCFFFLHMYVPFISAKDPESFVS